MKRVIQINQESIIESNIDIDIIDAAIIDFISSIPNWKKVVKIIHNDQIYYWISYELIINQLPLLKLKKDSVYRRIKKMEDLGLIYFHGDSQKLGKTFLRLTEKTTQIFFKDSVQPVYTKESEGSDLNPKVDENFDQKPPQNDKNGSDLNPEGFGFKSEGVLKEKEYTIKDIPKDPQEHFSFITVDYLKSLRGEISPYDHEGRTLKFKNYSYLISRPWEEIQEESKSETARLCEPYRLAVLAIMQEKYDMELKQEIASDNDFSQTPDL